MSTEPLSSLETTICGRCSTVCDPDDDFCRHCGMALRDERLPSLRNGGNVPTVWQPRIRGVAVKGAVFIAAGTLAEMLVRRMVRRALAPLAGKPRPVRGGTEMISSDAGAGVESETLLLRRIRIRR